MVFPCMEITKVFSQKAVTLNERQGLEQQKIALDIRSMMTHREQDTPSNKTRKGTESEVSCVGFVSDRG